MQKATMQKYDIKKKAMLKFKTNTVSKVDGTRTVNLSVALLSLRFQSALQKYLKNHKIKDTTAKVLQVLISILLVIPAILYLIALISEAYLTVQKTLNNKRLEECNKILADLDMLANLTKEFKAYSRQVDCDKCTKNDFIKKLQQKIEDITNTQEYKGLSAEKQKQCLKKLRLELGRKVSDFMIKKSDIEYQERRVKRCFQQGNGSRQFNESVPVRQDLQRAPHSNSVLSSGKLLCKGLDFQKLQGKATKIELDNVKLTNENKSMSLVCDFQEQILSCNTQQSQKLFEKFKAKEKFNRLLPESKKQCEEQMQTLLNEHLSRLEERQRNQIQKAEQIQRKKIQKAEQMQQKKIQQAKQIEELLNKRLSHLKARQKSRNK